ncbi:MAG: glycosyltransferase family 4 protein [Anaerolineales bacterium]|jgi:glycosyltransferase involved in cell wall biosynthesis
MVAKKPFRVCMLVHQNYYLDARVIQYVEGLVLSDISVDVVCVPEKGAPHPQSNERIRVYPVPIKRMHGGLISLLVEYFLSLFFYSFWLIVLYLKNQYKVIHVHNMPDFLVFSALIPRLLGARLILDIHDPMPEFYQSKYRARKEHILIPLLKLQERLSTALAHHVVTANPHFKGNLVSRGIPAEKVTVITNQPDPRVFDRTACLAERQKVHDHFTLIYPGTIAPRYGLDVAIRAIPVMVKHIPKLRLVIFGPLSDHAIELIQLADTLGVSDWVEFRHPIPLEEVPHQMALADVGIYPALPDPHMSIAIPGKVLEYAVMGLPIVASRLQILEELFPDESVLFFEPGNVEQFAACVLKLYREPALRSELVARADRVLSESQSWERERERYLALIHQLIK